MEIIAETKTLSYQSEDTGEWYYHSEWAEARVDRCDWSIVRCRYASGEGVESVVDHGVCARTSDAAPMARRMLRQYAAKQKMTVCV